MAYRHRGFWQPADTVKERNALEAAYQGGTSPWMLWEGNGTDPDRDPLQAAIAEMQNGRGRRDACPPTGTGTTHVLSLLPERLDRILLLGRALRRHRDRRGRLAARAVPRPSRASR